MPEAAAAATLPDLDQNAPRKTEEEEPPPSPSISKLHEGN